MPEQPARAERTVLMRAALLLIALTGSAAAETVHDPEPDEFIGVDAYGTLGLGIAIDHEDTTPAANYDYTLRLGRTFRASSRWRPGGFLELHSFDLETFDAAIGPQVQLRLGEQLALQLRGGVGVGSEGTSALAGVQLGTYYLGASVTVRRSFDTGDVVVSANIEVIALLPVAIGIALGAK